MTNEPTDDAQHIHEHVERLPSGARIGIVSSKRLRSGPWNASAILDQIEREQTTRAETPAMNRPNSFDRDGNPIYDPREDPDETGDPDSVWFRDTYTGPSERELNGGCNRCGGFDDCYCMDHL